MTHLPYETCLALKAAGFPQDIGQVVCVNVGGPNDGVYVVPSLSELISELGDDFEALTKQAGGFAAIPTNVRWMHKVPPSFGTTPEQAVANLYLAIKGNTNK